MFTLVHPASPYFNSKGDDGRRKAMMITALKDKYTSMNDITKQTNKQARCCNRGKKNKKIIGNKKGGKKEKKKGKKR